ncbi:uncharacterized protein LOC126184093 [Schistocerca cancellata]|uniref:uncharacterized protein LOC126184093 n=1 Tax=Schistocerca cancellata TaxID=274614 RepID=UPI00211977E3|nr:uncharacterized protein LOC126184093 [Schistocerca cancellata]
MTISEQGFTTYVSMDSNTIILRMQRQQPKNHVSPDHHISHTTSLLVLHCFIVRFLCLLHAPRFPQHETMRRLMLTSREAARPMTASSLNMKPPSMPSMEYKTKQKGGEFSEQRLMGVSASAMVETVSASTFNDTLPGRAPTEYTDNQIEGEFSEQRIMGVSASAMVETVSASTFNDTMPGRAPTEYTENQIEGELMQ